MARSALDNSVRPQIVISPVTDDIFRASGRSDRSEIDALCVNWDKAIWRNTQRSVVDWITKAAGFGLQMFIVGSRENLVSAQELRGLPATLIEMPASRAFVDDYDLMEWLSAEMERVYAPFRFTGRSFAAGDDLETSGDFYRSKLAELARTHSTVTLDRSGIGITMTEEEHSDFLRFLDRPASEPANSDVKR